MFHYGNFRFEVATNRDMIQQCQALRYRVYVEECGFENPQDHPQGLETDEFDETSIHLAATDERGRLVGTSRLILNSSRGLPIFHVLKGNSSLNRHSQRLAEVSRLAVDPTFRQRGVIPTTEGDGTYRFEGTRDGGHPSQDRRAQSVIPMGLMCLGLTAGIRAGLTECVMISEKKLWVLLKRVGILFRPIGEAVDYHGRRIPYLATSSEIGGALLNMHQTLQRQCGADREFVGAEV